MGNWNVHQPKGTSIFIMQEWSSLPGSEPGFVHQFETLMFLALTFLQRKYFKAYSSCLRYRVHQWIKV